MRTVGSALKEARLVKQLTLHQIEKSIKIRVNFLKALETNDFEKLPSFAVGRGFLKNYAEYLGLDTSSLLAVYRRDFDEPQLEQPSADNGFSPIPQGVIKPINQAKVKWTPKLTLITFLVIFFVSLVVYLGSQYLSLFKAPFLAVDTPLDGQQVTVAKIEVIGRTDPDTLITVNNQPVFISDQGEFRYKLELFPGENTVLVEAESKLGKKSTQKRVVFYSLTKSSP